MNKRPAPAETFRANLEMLMKAAGNISNRAVAAKCSEMSDRMIGKIRNGESQPTITTANIIASAFGLTGWQMLMPNLRADLAKSGKLEKLIDNYYTASAEGRKTINNVAEHAAKYGNGNNS